MGAGEVQPDFGYAALLGSGEGKWQGTQPVVEEVAGAAMTGPSEGVPMLAAAQDFDLKLEKFFEGKITPGTVFFRDGCREVNRAQSLGPALVGEFPGAGGLGQEVRDSFVFKVFQQQPEGPAKGFLQDAFAGSVNGGDTLQVDGDFFPGGVVEDFVFRVVDDEGFILARLRLAKKDNVLIGGKGFCHERHIEPAEGNRRAHGLHGFQASRILPVWRGDSDHDVGAATSGQFFLDIGDDSLQAEGGRDFRGSVRPTIEGGTVFITCRIMRQEVGHCQETARRQRFAQPGVEKGKGLQQSGQGHETDWRQRFWRDQPCYGFVGNPGLGKWGFKVCISVHVPAAMPWQ